MSKFVTALSRRRWLKRLIHPLLPEISSIKLNNYSTKGDFNYCVKDFTGPSFYVMYDGEKAFDQYEKINKNSIEDHLKDKSVFFDIGANIGLFGVYFKLKNPDLIVHAFEPEPLNFQCLVNTINSFSFTDFHLSSLGLSDQSGTNQLYVDKINMGGASVSLADTSRTAISIELTSLDEYVTINNIDRIDVIKIDVEGLEEKIIKGGIESIRRFKPLIIFECIHDEIEINNLIRSVRLAEVPFSIEQVKTKKMVNEKDFVEFVKNESSLGLIGTEYLIRFE